MMHSDVLILHSSDKLLNKTSSRGVKLSSTKGTYHSSLRLKNDALNIQDFLLLQMVFEMHKSEELQRLKDFWIFVFYQRSQEDRD